MSSNLFTNVHVFKKLKKHIQKKTKETYTREELADDHPQFLLEWWFRLRHISGENPEKSAKTINGIFATRILSTSC